MKSNENKRFPIWEYIFILLGSVLYALSTVTFIFPLGLLLGGTSGISVILTSFLPFSPGIILMIINFSLIVLAFLVLGRGMAVKTLVGSVLTTAFVGLFERLIDPTRPLIPNPYISATAGAVIIAVASGIMFYVDSSSGGTDIIALIVKKFSGIKIGKALLITDVLIVLVGGFLSGVTVLISSTIGLLIKTLGIDLVIYLIRKRIKDNQ
ncbi:MAG: YitT family protein [Clostridia bacterium]|nr:YitT family protein [Clostridia bacterium]